MNISSTREPFDNIVLLDLTTITSNNGRGVTDLDSTTADPGHNPYQQGTLAILAWSILYGVMVLTGLLGNAGICWIVYFNKRMRTVTNLFLANTAFADAMVVVFNALFNFTYAINNDWYFGVVFCHFINFLPVVSVCASILSITVISMDRFVIIMYPLRKRISKKQAKIILVCIWLLSMALCFPQGLFARWLKQGTRHLCLVEFPNGMFGKEHMLYQATFMTFSYFLPLSALAISYVFLGKKLWGMTSISIGDLNYSHVQKQRNNRKAVQMMMFVVVTFAVCWLPYHTYFLVGFKFPDIFNWHGIQQVYLAVFWLAMSSTMYNPFIYCWNNHRFRREFKNLLMLKFKGSRQGQPTIYSTGRRQTNGSNLLSTKDTCTTHVHYAESNA